MKLRVLLIAEACNPDWASVPLVGYQNARALARRPDLAVTVATHVRNRTALEADPIADEARLEFLDNEFIARPLYRASCLLRRGNSLSWTTNMALAWPAYMAFEWLVHRRFRRPLKQGEFDLIHRVTPLSPIMGSPLAGLTDVPMMIGPINGGLPWPTDYPDLRSREREWLIPVRSAYRHLPYYRSAYRNFRGVIAGSRHTASEIPRGYSGKRFYLPENGLDPGRFPLADSWPEPEGPFRFLTAGRLVPYKGMDLILEAMASSPALRACTLKVVGGGPERPHLEGLADRLGLGQNVDFTGPLGQRELAAEMRRSQSFVFPSLREFGGAVVLEAMANGLPPIVVDYGGPGELATPDCGILLPMGPRDRLVPALAEAMESLASDAGRCRLLAASACHRVREEFTWDAKAERLTGFYREVLDEGRS